MPVLRLLVENGAYVKNDPIALKNAIRYGDEEAAKILLEHGADPNTKFPSGRTALETTIGSGRKEKERLLREFGARGSRRWSSIFVSPR